MLANIDIIESIQNQAHESFAKNMTAFNAVDPCVTEKYFGAVNQVRQEIHNILLELKVGRENIEITADEEEIQWYNEGCTDLQEILDLLQKSKLFANIQRNDPAQQHAFLVGQVGDGDMRIRLNRLADFTRILCHEFFRRAKHSQTLWLQEDRSKSLPSLYRSSSLP